MVLLALLVLLLLIVCGSDHRMSMHGMFFVPALCGYVLLLLDRSRDLEFAIHWRSSRDMGYVFRSSHSDGCTNLRCSHEHGSATHVGT